MKIVDVLLSQGRTGFYFDDQRAIKSGAQHDGFFYGGESITEGFSKVRQSGEAISIMLLLEDGQIAFGDCAAVQYSGAGGRDPLFIAEEFIPRINKYIVPNLKNKEITTFKEMATYFDSFEIDGKPLHTAIRYGITQALLDAVSKAQHITMAEVIKNEYRITEEITTIPIFGQSGDDRYNNVDKMIIKGVDVLPHALINNIFDKLGQDGEKLKDYIKWLRNRILNNRTSDDYYPVLHIDVYGTIGNIFDNDIDKIVNYLEELSQEAAPLLLRIEGPVDVEDREKQVEVLSQITSEIDKRNIKLEIVADEWCNTLEDIKLFADKKAGHMVQIKTPDLGGVNNIVEAILYCKERKIGAYSGGTCNETNRSAEVTTNIAMACGAKQVLAKPGMGFDEGYMIVFNEMQRVKAIVNHRNNR